MHSAFRNLGRMAAVLALGSSVLVGQGTQTANISATVKTVGGAPLEGVTFNLSSPSLQGVRTFVSDSNGKVFVRLLPPGAYTVQLVKAGMTTLKEKVTLGIDQNWNANFTMVREGSAMVEVVSSTPAVDKTDVKSATNVNFDILDRLPQTRTPESAALMAPGVVTGVGDRIQIRGAMTSGNLNLMDGQNVSDNAYNNRGVRVIADSIEETQVITGAISAEYGDVDGGVVNSITKVGGNEFTGQLRWELSNPAWDAKAPTGFATDDAGNIVHNPDQTLANQLGESKTVSLGGYLIKDKLWFFVSLYNRNSFLEEQIGGSTPGQGGSGSDYTYGIKETRRQAKLTWAVTAEHTLTLATNNSQNSEKNRDYSSGTLSALVPQDYRDYFWNLDLKSVWSPTITSEIRYGQKHQVYTGGGVDNGQAPIYNYSTGYYVNQGIFNSHDGGDNRNNRTFNAKVTMFLEGAGSHQLDLGLDYYRGISRAANDASPLRVTLDAFGATGATNRSVIFGSGGRNFSVDGAGSGIPVDVWTFITGTGEAKNDSLGFYVNDKWQMDQHFNFQFGLRYDKFTAKNEQGASTASNGAFSPRLGMKYDLLGDSKWIFGASYARYNSKVLESITNAVTKQGNPTEIDYKTTLDQTKYVDFATIQNLQNYSFDAASISYYNDPTINVKLANKLKAPHVDELQASVSYTFKSADMGEGFAKLTSIYKKWSDLIDYRAGNDGKVDLVVGGEVIKSPYYKVWENSSKAKRYYHGLELDTAYSINQWSYTGNITWSTLEGNYEGEGSNTPGRGEGLENFTVVEGAKIYDESLTAPRGYLKGHVPLAMTLTLSRVKDNEYGQLTYGFIYRFTSGRHFSDTRTNYDPQGTIGVPAQYGSTLTEYLGARGTGVFNASAYLDLAITQDFTMFQLPVTGTKVRAFAKLVFANVLNHQQQISWNVDHSDYDGTVETKPWSNAPLYGFPTSIGDYATPRTITASAGFRF